ncbi:hypothetical protein P3342_000344 [Pyrenophora teres f. teres]|nr:hypothetical protein P3342_000344 [Pyrenophora teres f. teres]
MRRNQYHKPKLFRNVTLGGHITEYSSNHEIKAELEFTQFVPSRFKLVPGGTVSDQEQKQIIKLIDKAEKKRILANPAPRDWYAQNARIVLNKRTL